MWQTFAVLALALTLAVLVVISSVKRSKNTWGKSNLPPAPPRLPLIGNLHQLGGALPHHSLHALSKKHAAGGLMHLQLGLAPALVVSSPEAAREIMKTHDPAFAGRPPLKAVRLVLGGTDVDVAFSQYGDYWKQARRITVTHFFSPKVVQSFQRVKEEEVELMMNKLTKLSAGDSLVNMSRMLNLFSTTVVSRLITGKKLVGEEHKVEALCKLIEDNSAVLGAFHLADFFPVIGWLDLLPLDAMAKEVGRRWGEMVDEVIDKQISQHAADRRDTGTSSVSLLDALVSLQDDPSLKIPLTKRHIKALLIDMYAAGIDTSTSVMEWGMAELMRNDPEKMARLQAEVRAVGRGKDMIREEDLDKMSYLRAVIKEVMRLHPPIPLLGARQSVQDCEVAGYRIPKGTRVIINAYAMGRDGMVWEEPEEFKPERFMGSAVDYRGNDFELIPFGAGRRICPGINFSAQTIELALANLLYKFDWALPEGVARGELDMSESPGLIPDRKEELLLAAKLNPGLSWEFDQNT